MDALESSSPDSLSGWLPDGGADHSIAFPRMGSDVRDAMSALSDDRGAWRR